MRCNATTRKCMNPVAQAGEEKSSGASGRGETSRQLSAQDSSDDCRYKVTRTALFQSGGQRVDLRPVRRPGAGCRRGNRSGSLAAGICNSLL